MKNCIKMCNFSENIFWGFNCYNTTSPRYTRVTWGNINSKTQGLMHNKSFYCNSHQHHHILKFNEKLKVEYFFKFIVYSRSSQLSKYLKPESNQNFNYESEM